MKKLLFLLSLLMLLSLPTLVNATTTTYTWYFRSDTQTVNGVTGYVLNSTLSASTQNVSLTLAGNNTVEWGWRIWRLRNDNSSTEITSGTPVATVSRSTDGEGFQTGTYTMPSIALHIGWDAFKVNLYMKVGAGSWQLKAIFVTSRILEKNVLGSTWSFIGYTKRTYSGGDTTGYFIWGSSSRNSRITNVQFTDADVYENMNYKLQSGDFIGFVLYPYVNLVGNLFYGIVMLIICVPIYNRYHSLTPILVMFILFGGATGMFTLLMPVAGFWVGWVFLLLGLAGLLFRVFR